MVIMPDYVLMGCGGSNQLRLSQNYCHLMCPRALNRCGKTMTHNPLIAQNKLIFLQGQFIKGFTFDLEVNTAEG